MARDNPQSWPLDPESLDPFWPGLRHLRQDNRMQEVLDWFASIPQLAQYPRMSLHRFLSLVRDAMRMPGKPANMPPGRRAAYFDRVRKHAEALQKLLQDTEYDRHDEGEDIPDDQIYQYIDAGLFEARANDCDPDQYYKISRYGMTSLPSDYPWCDLSLMLSGLIEWTDEESCCGDRYFMPARVTSSRAQYFNCTMFELFLRWTGQRMPFGILASLAEVALELPEPMDVDTVQKQVQRYMEKVGIPTRRTRVQIHRR